MNMRFSSLYGFLFIWMMAFPFVARAEVINVPCISSQGSAGGWWYPTVKEEYFPLVLIKAQVWTRGIERHPLYTPDISTKTWQTKIELVLCSRAGSPGGMEMSDTNKKLILLGDIQMTQTPMSIEKKDGCTFFFAFFFADPSPTPRR